MPLPVNISVMNVDTFINQHQCKPVTSLFIRESSSDEFHHDGLFSEEIFGQIGSTDRLVTFGYINLRATIIQPLVYGYLIRIKSLYGEIMSGKTYAVFDKTDSDFHTADATDPGAGTGYKFFIDQFAKLKIKRTESASQNDKVEVIDKYRSSCLIDKYLVMPAGLRDMREDEGRPAADSINKLYSSLMNYVSALPMDSEVANSDIFDAVRFSIQKKANEIYEFIFDMMEGKFGYFQRKYSSRNLALGTRNVITPPDMSGTAPDDPAYLKCDEIKTPLYQAVKMYQPIMVYWLKNYTTKVFSQFSDQVALIDVDTHKLTYQPVSEDQKNMFTTSEGLEKIIALFDDTEFRFTPIFVYTEEGKKYYMYLIYDTGTDIWLVRDLEEFKRAYAAIGVYNQAYLRPLTYADLFYICGFLTTEHRYAYVTRYPAIEIGSTVPCKVHLGSTAPSRKVTYRSILNKDIALLPEYPVIGAAFVDSTVLHPSILKGLTADFDGDTVSVNGVLSNEANEEIRKHLDSKERYIHANGSLMPQRTDLISLTIFNLARDPIDHPNV